MKKAIAPFSFLALTLSADAQDVAVSRIGGTGDDFQYYGQAEGKHAYSFGTTSCNVGPIPIWWYTHDSGGSPGANQHPVIAQNLFRIADGRIEQLGQSFLKHGFCAVNETTCGTCIPTSCDTLGVGCADTYGSGLNDGRFGGAKSDIDATSGANTYPLVTPPTTGSMTIRGRLQVDVTEWALPGEIYLAEAQYVSEHDQLAGNGRNNASWREVEVDPSTFAVQAVGPTMMGDPAIRAWEALETGVTIETVMSADEGGPGVPGMYLLGYRVEELGGGQWRYEYALQNFSSRRAAGSFALPLCTDGVELSELYFRDVEYHSGEPYDGTDWVATVTASEVRWETTTPHSVDPEGNALRWRTLYNFGFTADAPPASATARIGLFVPGTPSELTASVEGPCPADCGSVASYCGPAIPNSTGLSAEIAASGSLMAGDDGLTLSATHLPTNRIGYFLMGSGSNTFFPPNSQGRYCLGGADLIRLLTPVLNSGDTGLGHGEYELTPTLSSIPVLAGETWNFQSWFRDQNPGSTSNFTDAVAVTFCD